MLWTIAVVLVILWLLGLGTGYTMGYFIHTLLVVAMRALPDSDFPPDYSQMTSFGRFPTRKPHRIFGLVTRKIIA